MEEYSIKSTNLCDKIEEFEEALYSLFGSGTNVVIKVIRVLYDEFNLPIPIVTDNLKAVITLLREMN